MATGGRSPELPPLLAGVVTSVARGRLQERLPLPEGAGRAATGCYLQGCPPTARAGDGGDCGGDSRLSQFPPLTARC